MTDRLSREIRLCALTCLVMGGYAIIVSMLAVSLGQTALLRIENLSKAIQIIWVLGFAFVFIFYALDLVARRRPSRPLLAIWDDIKVNVLPTDLIIARLTVTVMWALTMTFFSPFKMMIPHIHGFTYDAAFAEVDRLLFLGQDPWRVTHALFGGVFGTFLLHFIYTLWFFLMWLSVIYLMLRPELVAVRVRYVLAFPLCWILVGSLAAVLMSSAGPCYYERLLGDPTFRPLMDRLAATHEQVQALTPNLGIFSLKLQDTLWAAYKSDSPLFGGGITAMPSMHVSIAVLMACGAFKLNRRFGWIMAINAVLIWIGSIHLGWHYALDGIVSLVLTLGIWRLAGFLADRYVLVERPLMVKRRTAEAVA